MHRNRAICICSPTQRIQAPGYQIASWTTFIITHAIFLCILASFIVCNTSKAKPNFQIAMENLMLSWSVSFLGLSLRYTCATCYLFSWLWKWNNPLLPRTTDDISVNAPPSLQGSYATYHSSDYFDETIIDIGQYRWMPELSEGFKELLQCSICMEEVVPTSPGVEISKLPCRHIFHEDCLGNWLLRNPTCPLCRAIL